MLYSPETGVDFDAAMLLDASASAKHVMLEAIIGGMIDGNSRASNTAIRLGGEVATNAAVTRRSVKYDTLTAHGNLLPEDSLTLLQGTARVSGFGRAVKRLGEQRKKQTAIMEVGCGPFPYLSLAAALYNPYADIIGLEINPRAADRAESIAKAFGLSDRIRIVNDDISKYKIDPNTTASITETFGTGLVHEPGPRVIRILHEAGIPFITPSQAQLRLEIAGDSYFQWIDLREETEASIEFYASASKPSDNEEAKISAAYHDDLGLVLDYGLDPISGHMFVEKDDEPQSHIAFGTKKARLSYELGTARYSPKLDILETYK